MYTRSAFTVQMAAAMIASSATSTVNCVTIDLANYFPVGKREVKFVVSVVTNSTITAAANVTIEESASTASAASTVTSGFTTLVDYAGSSATWTSTADTSVLTGGNFIVNYRYVRVKYNAAQATTGSNLGIAVAVIPLVRAM